MEAQGSHCAGVESGGLKEVRGREGDRRGAKPEKGLSRRHDREWSPSRLPGLYATGCTVQRWKRECTPVRTPIHQCAKPAQSPIHTTAGQCAEPSERFCLPLGTHS